MPPALRSAILILAAAMLVACDRVSFPDAAPKHKGLGWRARLFDKPPQPPPPPPPPPPTDPHGIGPSEPPEQVRKFTSSLQPKSGPPSVTIFDLTDGAGVGTFAGQAFAKSQQLPPAKASETLVFLASPFSYTENHPLCTDPGFGLRVVSGEKTLDLIIGLTCRHVHDASSREEIGILSEAGHAYFKRLYERSF